MLSKGSAFVNHPFYILLLIFYNDDFIVIVYFLTVQVWNLEQSRIIYCV